MEPKDRLYYVEYSRKMASGGRLKLRAVWTGENLAWYLLNSSERYDYIVDSARTPTDAEIDEFTPKSYDDRLAAA